MYVHVRFYVSCGCWLFHQYCYVHCHVWIIRSTKSPLVLFILCSLMFSSILITHIHSFHIISFQSNLWCIRLLVKQNGFMDECEISKMYKQNYKHAEITLCQLIVSVPILLELNIHVFQYISLFFSFIFVKSVTWLHSC